MKTNKEKEYRKRVDLKIPLKQLSTIILKNYDIGNFVSNRVLYLGYGDFSYILVTTYGKYLVKIINKETPSSKCQSVVDRYLCPSLDKRIFCPKVFYTKNGKSLLVVNIHNTNYRLFVMEYLNGFDLYTLNYKILSNDLEKIAKQIAYINQIKTNVDYIYDPWAIESFVKEYSKFNKYKLNKNVLSQIEFWKSKFENIALEELPKCFTHGDVVDMNIMICKNDFFIVDFSSANNQHRLSDIAVSIADLCFVKENLHQTVSNIKIFLSAYEKENVLTSYEKDNLLTFVAIATIIGYLNTFNHDGEYIDKLKQKYTDNLYLLKQIKNLKF